LEETPNAEGAEETPNAEDAEDTEEEVIIE
jgi:hypothetical protein